MASSTPGRMPTSWQPQVNRPVGIGPSRRPRRATHDWAGVFVALLTAVAAMALVVVVALQVFGPEDPAQRLARSSAEVETTVDLPVENVFSRLPDGREARGSFVLRLRSEDAPAQLVTAARATPTPTDEQRTPGFKTPVPAVPNLTETLVRQEVGTAMARLGTVDVLGGDGKERLRLAVRDAVNDALPGKPVEAVFIRDFIIK